MKRDAICCGNNFVLEFPVPFNLYGKNRCFYQINCEYLDQINCEYLDTFDFVKNVKPKLMEEPKLNVICFNIRSIRDKWANFKDLILINGYYPFDIIGITETWLSEIDDTNEFSLPAFQAIRIERKLTKSSDAISLYIRSSLKFTRLLDCESLFSQTINNRCVYSIIVDISVDEN